MTTGCVHMRFLRPYPGARRDRGFTLVELAVVVLVVGLLIGSLLVPLSTQVDQRNASEAQRRLEDAREALLGFAISNGRFPCPASVASSTTGTEEFAVSPAGNSTNGICMSFSGYLPGQTLGLNNLDASGYALDGYPMSQPGQGRIRYAIADATLATIQHVLTATGQMRAVGIAALGPPTPPPGPYLYVCGSSTGMTLTSCGTTTNSLALGNAVFIVYSLGKNGTLGASLDEQKNINTIGSKTFLGRNYSSVSSQEFDDQLLWVSSYTLISRMVAAGVLP